MEDAIWGSDMEDWAERFFLEHGAEYPALNQATIEAIASDVAKWAWQFATEPSYRHVESFAPITLRRLADERSQKINRDEWRREHPIKWLLLGYPET